jgi:hypothetical protein
MSTATATGMVHSGNGKHNAVASSPTNMHDDDNNQDYDDDNNQENDNDGAFKDQDGEAHNVKRVTSSTTESWESSATQSTTLKPEAYKVSSWSTIIRTPSPN